MNFSAFELTLKSYRNSSLANSLMIFNSFHNFHDVIVGVGGQGVLPGVRAQRRTPRNIQVKGHKPGARLIELKVPIAVGR